MDASRASAAEPGELDRRDALIHREFLQIAVLIVIALAGFFLTRAVAANARNITFADAEAWFERGQQQVATGQIEPAIESLRRAVVRNRYERRYALALARALAQQGDVETARTALLTLREASPEDADINLELARLAARRSDVTEAVRFYHNALYAPWPNDAADTRRQVRFELIELLLENGQTRRALSELLALSSDLPGDADTHIRMGRLFARAGDSRHARDQYELALKVAPDDRAALAGAALTAFQMGDFPVARDYLRRAPADGGDLARIREVTTLVLAHDPLARRLGAAERRRRVAADVEYVLRRLADCPAAGAMLVNGSQAAVPQELDALRERLAGSAPIDQDAIEGGIDLIDRAEQAITSACGQPTPWDQALILIARQHGSETR